MQSAKTKKRIYIGITYAILATIIWSGNFVVARGVIKEIPPISLAFYRWLTATIIIAPFGIQKFNREKTILWKNWKYIFWVSFLGITVYNTLIYVGGHSTSAINLALIGTTSSPVMSIILAAIFLREKIKPLRIAGLFICIAGIIFLLSGGSWERLIAFHFSPGDWWVLLAALIFAIYNILVRRKPAALSPVNFLYVTFMIGTILLFPAYLWEIKQSVAVSWNIQLLLIILYLGLGNSVLAFLFWNEAIARLGAGRTALFGNLITVFSTLEAVLFLQEKVTVIHLVSAAMVIGGLIIANLRKTNTV